MRPRELPQQDPTPSYGLHRADSGEASARAPHERGFMAANLGSNLAANLAANLGANLGASRLVQPAMSSDGGPSESDSALLRLEEAAVRAGVSVRTLARYRKSGALEIVSVGRRVYCSLEAIRRAMVRRSLQQVWRDVTDPTRTERPLAEWLGDLQTLAEMNSTFESPETHRAYVGEVLRRYPRRRTGEYTVADLIIVAAALEHRGIKLASLSQISSFEPSMLVIDALRQLHCRFGA
jgi:hypothetical protein